MKRITLNQWASLATIVGVLLTVPALWFAAHQIFLATEIAASQNLIDLEAQFTSNPTNTGIVTAIDNDAPILEDSGGSFTYQQLDNYLGQFDTIYSALTHGFLEENDLCNSFSYYIDAAFKNDEIQTYITQKYFYSSLFELNDYIQKSKNLNCRQGI